MSSGDYVELSGTEPQPVSQLENVVTIEYGDFVEYLSQIVPLVLKRRETAAFINSLNDAKHQECIKKFISDPQVRVLYIQRSLIKDEDTDQTESAEDVIYYVANDVFYTPRISSIVFVKIGAVLEADKSIESQLLLTNFSKDSPYAPYFKSCIKESEKAEREGDKMVPSVEKEITELEMGLLHRQQNIDIPEITLEVHPTVANVIKKCSEEGRKPKVADFGELVEESTFLNQLQNGVNGWIKEIQKVTKLDRDPSSGTALQEISFWLNLERALHRIQEKRESTEVTLTLDVLEHGKRFHATVSFDADTLLQQALATVNDYSPLMKDFPINDLLSATELDKIREAVGMIFNHLRKIPATKYPIQRALRLVEAISRDLSSQLLKVLGTRLHMHKPLDEFEKILTQCFDIFTTWEDEYDKLQGLLRDIMKKKRDENIKTIWRIHPSHKRLQNRMKQMRKLRRQHEQLRSDIVRVLKPAPTVGERAIEDSIPADEVEGALTMMDAADANAIEEVNLAYEYVKELDCLDISREGNDLWDAAVQSYEDSIDRVEARIMAPLRDQLEEGERPGRSSSRIENFIVDEESNSAYSTAGFHAMSRWYSRQYFITIFQKYWKKINSQSLKTTFDRKATIKCVSTILAGVIVFGVGYALIPKE